MGKLDEETGKGVESTHEYQRSRLLKTEINMGRDRADAKVYPIDEGNKIELWIDGSPFWMTPEQAFTIGKSLVQHAEELGCDSDTGERPVNLYQDSGG